jgi:hypothetical protein
MYTPGKISLASPSNTPEMKEWIRPMTRLRPYMELQRVYADRK